MDTKNSVTFASNAMVLVANISNGKRGSSREIIVLYKVGKLQTKQSTNNDQM
jgi:hypothetical protein